MGDAGQHGVALLVDAREVRHHPIETHDQLAQLMRPALAQRLDRVLAGKLLGGFGHVAHRALDLPRNQQREDDRHPHHQHHAGQHAVVGRRIVHEQDRHGDPLRARGQLDPEAWRGLVLKPDLRAGGQLAHELLHQPARAARRRLGRMLVSRGGVGHLDQARQRHRRLRVERALDALQLEHHLLDRIVNLLLPAVHAQDGQPREMADEQHGRDQQRHAAEQGVDPQLHCGMLSSASSGTKV
ncbi:hypothetical protein D3C86_1453470 [compost metagenome]